MEAIYSSETTVLMKTTRRYIPEDETLHSHRRENLNLTGLSAVQITNHEAEPFFLSRPSLLVKFCKELLFGEELLSQ
jgi:hypothetical protein